MNSLALRLHNKSIIKLSNIKMLVFDMAGTTVDEGGIIYDTLQEVIEFYNLPIKKNEIHEKWHGKNKHEVLNYYLQKKYKDNWEDYAPRLQNLFDSVILRKYSEDSNIKLIHPKLPIIFNHLRKQDIKIALNTGYPRDIQNFIIDKLNMNEFIDDFISSEDVSFGRPYPYMIYKLMEKNNIQNINSVIKFGDTTNDILEAKNAGCTYFGVLSGAETKETLEEYCDNYIIKDVTEILYEE